MKGGAGDRRWLGAERAGDAAGPPAARADQAWGLAARGALVEAGGPPLGAHWSSASTCGPTSRRGCTPRRRASQWDPATAVDWTAPARRGPAEVERAVVQVMTYLVENEQAALMVPARLLAQLHPHFREVMQLLATQVADEARHVEVFTRRALLSGGAARHLVGRRPGLAADAARRAGLHHGVVPAVGARRGHLPRPAALPRTTTPPTRSPPT